MIDVYVDLDISTSGATGTVVDPLGYDEFTFSFGNPLSYNQAAVDIRYRIKGKHTYIVTGPGLFVETYAVAIRFEAWGLTPPLIKIVLPQIMAYIDLFPVQHLTSLDFVNIGFQIIAQAVLVGEISIVYVSNACAVSFDKCLIMYDTSAANPLDLVPVWVPNGTLAITNCDFKIIGLGTNSNAIINTAGSAGYTISDCHFEALSISTFFNVGGSIGTADHCEVYNSPNFTAWGAAVTNAVDGHTLPGPKTFPIDIFNISSGMGLFVFPPPPPPPPPTTHVIAGEFTLQFWVKGYTPAITVFRLGTATVSFVNVAGHDFLRYVDGSGTYSFAITRNGAGWAHYAVVRDGNRITAYENGIAIGNHGLSAISVLYGSFITSNAVNTGGVKALYDVRLYLHSISAEAIAYYYTNVTTDNGNAFIW